jgi:uncharacterized membrane protein YeaQ/YmgE (transglycosylase-associated protein family)
VRAAGITFLLNKQNRFCFNVSLFPHAIDESMQPYNQRKPSLESENLSGVKEKRHEKDYATATHLSRIYSRKARHMSIIGWLIFGGLVGWMASKLMGTDARQGVLLNMIVGVVGALLGGFLWAILTQDPDPYRFGHMGSWVTAIVGASVFLWVVSFMRPSERNSFGA